MKMHGICMCACGAWREPCGEGWAERPRAEPGAVEKEGAGDPVEGRWVSVAVQSLSMCLREVCGPCDGESLCSVSSRCGFPRKEVVLLRSCLPLWRGPLEPRSLCYCAYLILPSTCMYVREAATVLPTQGLSAKGGYVSLWRVCPCDQQ